MTWAPRVFWKSAHVEEVSGGFTVRLDGRPVKTPAKAELLAPTRAMAQASAAEWAAQDSVVDPLTMPVTRAVNAAIDKVTPQRDEVVSMLADYGDADLTCYRADRPAGLVARQTAAWDPLLDWATETHGARLIPVEGVMHAPQSAQALSRLAAPLHEMSVYELTAMHDLISLTGSLVIGLAAEAGHLTLEDLWARSRVDEIWQIEQWGEDEDANAAAEAKRRSFAQAAYFLTLARVPDAA